MTNSINFVFQPIFNLEDMSIYGYEALMRSPNDNIINIINNLKEYSDFYELEKTTWFKGLEEFKNRGYDGKIFINSFPHICLRKKDLIKITDLYYDLLSRLVIELIETNEIDNEAYYKKKGFAISNNCSFALDDFNTGFNNLKTYIYTQPEYLKIDKNIINNKDIKMLEGIIKMTKNKSILIAEGIETKEQLKLVKDLGITYGQGYYLGMPK